MVYHTKSRTLHFLFCLLQSSFPPEGCYHLPTIHFATLSYLDMIKVFWALTLSMISIPLNSVLACLQDWHDIIHLISTIIVHIFSPTFFFPFPFFLHSLLTLLIFFSTLPLVCVKRVRKICNCQSMPWDMEVIPPLWRYALYLVIMLNDEHVIYRWSVIAFLRIDLTPGDLRYLCPIMSAKLFYVTSKYLKRSIVGQFSQLIPSNFSYQSNWRLLDLHRQAGRAFLKDKFKPGIHDQVLTMLGSLKSRNPQRQTLGTKAPLPIQWNSPNRPQV